MQIQPRLRLFVLVLAVAAAATFASAAEAVTVPFRSTFNLDTVGLPPGVGGESQPTALMVPAGSSITVVASSLGLDGQPVELFSADGSATWMNWNVSPAVSDFGVDVRFSVSFGELNVGNFFDLHGPGGVKVRLQTTAGGSLTLTDGCGAAATLGSYSAGTPVPVILQFAPPASYWVIADGENDGFENNSPVASESCRPGNFTGLYVYSWRGDFDTNPLTVVFDDLYVTWLPIFTDDFESGDTDLWSEAQP